MEQQMSFGEQLSNIACERSRIYTSKMYLDIKNKLTECAERGSGNIYLLLHNKNKKPPRVYDVKNQIKIECDTSQIHTKYLLEIMENDGIDCSKHLHSSNYIVLHINLFD